MPFGLRTRRKKEENIREIPEIIYPIEYLGGHKLFPNDKTRAAVGLFTDRMEILGGPLHLIIPYSDITGVESYQQGVKINKAAILPFGILPALLSSKKRIVTVMQYKNDFMTDEEQTLYLDFDNNTKQSQSVIYQRMIENKASDVAPSNFTIKSDKPDLRVLIQVTHPSLHTGDEQNIRTIVYDAKTNEQVIGAKINGDVVSPRGLSARLEEDITDDDGQVSYTWKIPESLELGTHVVTLYVVAKGYRSSVTKTTFEVSE